MKRMVQMPILKPRSTSADRKGVFGLSLLEVDKLGLADKGVPLVVRSMVEFLREHGLEQEGLFRVNGSVRAVDGLKERLEREEDVRLGQEVDVCAVASLLKQFLRDLPEGLVLPAVQSLNEDGCSQALRALLQDLPAAHYSLLKYLCHFLTEVEQQHKENRMTALNLATVFGPNVFHVSAGLDGIQEQNICNKIMTKLIQNYSNIFETDTEPGNQDEKMVETNIITVKVSALDVFFRELERSTRTFVSADPVPAYSSWQRESMDREEARLSPHAGGCLIRQLLEEGSDPMVSPRFYAYGHSQQYLDDTEVPPSPPNAHFVSRRRSSSLGSCDEDREELTSAQLSKKIHSLKRKIRKFEEKFEDERKYRPSHGDKAANPEVLRWMNELAKLRKDLKDHKLLKSEEDLTPMPRQRSNTLPKSFGSQLEKKPVEPKTPKPPVEATLESVMAKLEEKRKETGRPEDIKDMTREQIGAEKVALQKALLYYESIHGRPVTKTERQIMKPLYDRYRLVKQILCRASTIPVIGSPSSKRRGPLLQPIIEGVPALFFDDIKTQVTVSVKPELSMLGILEQLDEEVDGFISPVDELSPSKNTTDMRLSNLHSATTQELVEQLQEAREEKKRIRKNLREFEDQFFRQNGRNVQKEDRSPLAVEYNEYKHIKAKLRLLEVLISKRDSSKFI
uniref:Rho-GAP domain-containing protein n=1 Tax=Denticeps clupeoides TaxID=299321 RepID=A0AAY4AQN7_9TELE